MNDWQNLTPSDISAMSRQVNEARGVDMTNVFAFPVRPRPLRVPTSDLVVREWANMAACKIALAMNPNEHNRKSFDAAMRRYKAACEKAGWPA